MRTVLYILLLLAPLAGHGAAPEIRLTLIPPTRITTAVTLDIRAGLIAADSTVCDAALYLDRERPEALLHAARCPLVPGEGHCVSCRMPTAGKAGKHRILLVVRSADGRTLRTQRPIEIRESALRSTRRIDGAWAGLYHWSEQEGRHWNRDIAQVTDRQWRQIVRDMHALGMDIIVIQEVFRKQAYVGQHTLTPGNYDGLAFYPSALYAGRMPVAAHDPLEAILSEADRLGMHVLPGVGLFAWFDFSEPSLRWHEAVARELWERYGHHPSFYGFYVSEESVGSLDNCEADAGLRAQRKAEIVRFFREFRRTCNRIAPSLPVMLATNSMGVAAAEDTYPLLLSELDILCPFGFARMPAGDMTGHEAANCLQRLCDQAGAHLWFDLEAFLFNEDGSLYPRDAAGIIGDLTLLDNFEKVLCYQYPGVFNRPCRRLRIGEERTRQLYKEYKRYIRTLE